MSGHAILGYPMGGVNHKEYDCGGQFSCNPCTPVCLTDPDQNPPGTGWTYRFSQNAVYNTMQSYASTYNFFPGYPGVDSSSYLPYENFSNLVGCPVNGTWKMEVCDYWALDNGWIFWWGLELDDFLQTPPMNYTITIDTITIQGPDIIQSTATTFTIHPDSLGIFPYLVHIKDAFGCEYDTLVQVNVVPCTGIQEPEETDRISIFPVPASEFVTITYPQNEQLMSWELYSALGKKIHHADLKTLIDSNHSFTLQTSGLPGGTFFLNLRFKNKSIQKKLVVIP